MTHVGKKIICLFAGMWVFPILKSTDALCVSISSGRHINALLGDAVCRKHPPLQDG